MKRIKRAFLLTVLVLLCILAFAACHSINTYTVTFDKQGGIGGSDSAIVTYDSDMPQVTAPVRECYAFSGYFSEINGSGDKYYNADMTSAKTWDIPSNTALYAFWTPVSWNAVGSGTSSDPYIIYNAEQLTSLSEENDNNFSGVYFNLGEDIDLGGMEWTPLCSYNSRFAGTFDGKRHAVSNFKITPSYNYVGLFGYNSGTILNLGVENFMIDINRYDNLSVGGLVGYNSGTITNCHTTGDVSAYATGDVSGSGHYSFTGGLVGCNNGTITSCYTTGNVNAYGPRAYAGGLAGVNEGAITNSYATGNISASDGYYVSAGGLVGVNSSAITNSYATGNVSASEGSYVCAGGLIAYSRNSTIKNCYAAGNVSITASSTATAMTGGLVGQNDEGTITNCYCYSKQIIKINDILESANTEGIACSIIELNTDSFYLDTLWWDSDIWNFDELDFENGKFPRLK